MKIFSIIVTFNGSSCIRLCLDRLKGSSVHSNITVIDNNSDDDSVEIIKKYYPEVTLIESKVNLGFGKANNIGINHALKKGADYFFLINQDAWIFPDTLQTLIDANKKDADYLIVSPIHVDGTTKKMDYNFIRYIKSSDDFINDLVLRNSLTTDIYPLPFINAAIWLLSKKCVMEIGGFDPLYQHYGEDQDYTNRIKFHGYKIGFCPNAFGVHDRDQNPVAFHELSGKRRLNRHYKNYLIDLKNINKPLFSCAVHVLTDIVARSVKYLMKLQFNYFWIEIEAGLSLFMKTKKIHRHRNIVKAKGPAFLEGIQKRIDIISRVNSLN